MVDTRDLKSLGHYGCTSSSLVSGTSLLLSCSAGGSFFAVPIPLYMYMGWYCLKEGKNNEKLTYCFVDMWKLICQPCKIIVYDFLVRVRTCARLPTAMLFFCCHKCHTPRKRWTKNSRKFSETQEEKRDFRYLLPRTNPTRITSLLIFIQGVSAMTWKPVKYNFLVTLVTAKKQKLL